MGHAIVPWGQPRVGLRRRQTVFLSLLRGVLSSLLRAVQWIRDGP